MKKIFLFATRPFYYIMEIPPLLLLIPCFIYNGRAQNTLKLYPLICVCILTAIFIFVFFFRYIKLTYEEVRTGGPFSSHDSALIRKDTRLALTRFGGGRIRVELFGIVNERDFDWDKNEDDYKSRELNLFRERANGGKRTMIKILAYYGVDKADAKNIFTEELFTKEYENVFLKSEIIDDKRTVSITFKETI